jgi:phage tail-like protein
MSRTGVRFDPVRAFNFTVGLLDSSSQVPSGRVSVDDFSAGGFSEVSGLEMTLEVEDFKEGGKNDAVRHFATRMTWSNLRLKQGVALSDDLWNWHYDFVLGRGRRRDGVIALNNEDHKPVRVWRFLRGLPVKWTGPTLDAARSEVAIEEIEIAHEGLELIEAQTLMTIGEAIELGQELVGEAKDSFQKGKSAAQQLGQAFG